MVFGQYIANDYIRAFILFLGFLLILRITASVLERVILRAVKKTKTDLDDIIVKKSSIPITVILFFISLKISLNEISLSQRFEMIMIELISSIIIIMIGYLIYVIIDVAVFRAWNIFAKKANIGIGESLGSLIHGVLKGILIILILVYLLDIWGVDIGPLLAGLGIAGLAIALALQPALGNIFSGLSMIFDKSIGIGDVVYLDLETRGKIDKIGLRSTRIRTFDNELIIVPNSTLASSKIQNVALPEPKTRVVVPFGVAYGSDIEKVKKVVMKEVLTLKNISKEPEPIIRFLEMADSSLNFKAYFHVEPFENRIDAIDEINTKIYNALNKNNIEIPFPQRDVHIKK